MPSCSFVFRDSSEDADIGELRQRTGCQGVIERPLPSLPVSLPTQTAPSSLAKYHFCLCLVLVKHTIQKIPSISSAFFRCGGSVPAPSRGRAHNHCRISADSGCGDAGKCTKSKQSVCACCVCLCADILCMSSYFLFLYVAVWMHVLSLQPHHSDDRYLITHLLGSTKPQRSDLPPEQDGAVGKSWTDVK